MRHRAKSWNLGGVALFQRPRSTDITHPRADRWKGGPMAPETPRTLVHAENDVPVTELPRLRVDSLRGDASGVRSCEMCAARTWSGDKATANRARRHPRCFGMCDALRGACRLDRGDRSEFGRNLGPVAGKQRGRIERPSVPRVRDLRRACGSRWIRNGGPARILRRHGLTRPPAAERSTIATMPSGFS